MLSTPGEGSSALDIFFFGGRKMLCLNGVS